MSGNRHLSRTFPYLVCKYYYLKTHTIIGIGIATGLVIAGLALFIAARTTIIREDESKYDFDTTLAELEKAIGAADWKIQAVTNMQTILKNFDMEVRKIKVYEVCKPELAYEILSRDRERIVSSLMPCRISVL